MVQWRKLFGTADRDTHQFRDEMSRRTPLSSSPPDTPYRLPKAPQLIPLPVLPIADAEAIRSAYPPAEVTKVALRLKYQIEQVIPCELEEWKVTKANSPVITRKVALTAKEAGGAEYKSCVVYCLLVCKRWFTRLASLELWDADLHEVRAVACEVLAKKL